MNIKNIKDELEVFIKSDWDNFKKALDKNNIKKRCKYLYADYYMPNINMTINFLFLFDFILCSVLGLNGLNILLTFIVGIVFICIALFITHLYIKSSFYEFYENKNNQEDFVKKVYFNDFLSSEISTNIQNYLNKINPQLINLILLMDKKVKKTKEINYFNLYSLLERDLEKCLIFLDKK